MVSPSTKRRAIQLAIETGVGTTAQACRALGMARSSYYRNRTASRESRRLHGQIVALSQKHPRYCYRRVTAVLRREGQEINAKRVQRVRRQEGLQVSRRQRKLRRLGVSTAQRQRASEIHDVWSWDFVEDQTEKGTRFRVLTLIDEHTRQCLATHVDWSIRAVDVIRVVAAAMTRYDRPRHLRSDNGPEFIAYAIQDWLKEKNVKTIYITPGSPWENAYIESFHDKLRDECLNREIFGTLWEARVVIEQWRLEYNTERPHSSLGYQTPVEFAGRAIGPLPFQSGYALLPGQRTEHNLKPVAGLSQ
jgi:transposase InsO family protein